MVMKGCVSEDANLWNENKYSLTPQHFDLVYYIPFFKCTLINVNPILVLGQLLSMKIAPNL